LIVLVMKLYWDILKVLYKVPSTRYHQVCAAGLELAKLLGATPQCGVLPLLSSTISLLTCS